MIHTILVSVTHNHHYLNKYINFISLCQAQNKNYSGYTEKHHICPRAMFPEFSSFSEFPWNCAKLTPRQHYIAHLLLYKTYPYDRSQVQTIYFMTNLRGVKVTSKLYTKLKLEAIEASKGKVIVRDSKGDTFQVDKTDSRYLSRELVHITTGKVIVKDTVGNNLQVELTDSRYLARELLHINVGKVTVKDSTGNTFQTDKTDLRYLTGELVGATKGRVNVRDTNGKNIQVEITDSRYLAGELVHVTKDRISEKRTLTIEQIKEIRLAVKNPTTIITDDYIACVVKTSQKYKVGKLPFEELKYKNGRSLTYNSLLTMYYADNFKIHKKIISDIIDNKYYKEVTV